MDLDWGRILYAAWALAMLVVWTLVVRFDWGAYQRDRRDNLADLLSDLAMLLSAIAGAAALVFLLAGIQGWRGLFIGVFLGGFLGAGIAKLTLRRRRA